MQSHANCIDLLPIHVFDNAMSRPLKNTVDSFGTVACQCHVEKTHESCKQIGTTNCIGLASVCVKDLTAAQLLSFLAYPAFQLQFGRKNSRQAVSCIYSLYQLPRAERQH